MYNTTKKITINADKSVTIDHNLDLIKPLGLKII